MVLAALQVEKKEMCTLKWMPLQNGSTHFFLTGLSVISGQRSPSRMDVQAAIDSEMEFKLYPPYEKEFRALGDLEEGEREGGDLTSRMTITLP